MEWSKPETSNDGSVKIPANWIHLHYYEAVNILFRIENSVRVFAYAVLKNELSTEWINASISTDDAQQATIKSAGRRRIAQAKQFGYLGYMSPCPLLYLSMGELVQLMFSEAYWKFFSPYFPGKKETMKLKLDEIISIRNSLAHFRPIRVDDVDVIRQNAKHALMGIEKFLAELTRCNIPVPSNSAATWYKELMPLGTDHVDISLHESRGGEWVNLRFDFTPPVISQEMSDSWLDCRTVKLNAPAIASVVPEIVNFAVYVTEGNYRRITPEKNFSYRKELNFIFRRSTLESQVAVISDAVKKLLLQVSEETTLVVNDDMARGDLLSVEQVWGYSSEKDGHKNWNLNIESLESPPNEDDMPEFWGDMGWFGTEFVTTRARYPWMSSSVSSSEFG